MRWFSGLFSILCLFIASYRKKKNWNPDWYFSTHNAGLTRVWSYETFIVIETVIDRYLAVEIWEGLNKLIIMIYTQNNNKQ
jgi:hypothetical protein